jgi:hypothetical protein
MPIAVSDFEKLGIFYLGKRYDLSVGRSTDELFLYDSTDLLTHAVCIGMTGSGKTGLCLDLIEEAAIDGVPVIAIDPKGDISDLLLTFPSLSKEEFLPWVSEEDAKRNGLTLEQFAEQQSKRWREGLAQWHQDGDRIGRLRQSAEFAVYTPGSRAGRPVSILGSLNHPSNEVRQDSDAYKEKINSTAGPLLAMLGLDTDPLKSREHILLATILAKSWSQNKDLSLADLIQLIQKPPLTTIGALDLESFFPAKDRFAFAMAINNLLAAPGFDAWLKGDPLLIDTFLYTKTGSPKVSIFSIAHLSDSERMFFVTLLLSQIVSWMRSQSGTTSLRAIIYMDEIFGFFPPVSNPPSKLPLLTLLKQARAFGLGIVLASQNPVDLDYKGLANAGTWFIGRLQTERDKLRVLDGLEGAASEAGSKFDRQAMERTLAGLTRRVFLVNNVHAEKQEVIETRWSLSYLRGPLTKAQIKSLMNTPNEDAPPAGSSPGNGVMSGTVTPNAAAGEGITTGNVAGTASSQSNHAGAVPPGAGGKPALPPGVKEFFLSTRAPGDIVYKPLIVGAASIRFTETKSKLDQMTEKVFLAELRDDPVTLSWSDATEQRFSIRDLDSSAPSSGTFLAAPPPASNPTMYKAWSKQLIDWLVSHEKFHLLFSQATEQYSLPNEPERQFRIRLNDCAVAARDKIVQQLRKKYAPKVTALQDKILQAQQKLQREQDEAKEHEMQAAISIGATVLGAFAGRRSLGRGASAAAREAARVATQKQEIARAEELVANYKQQFDKLQEEFAQEAAAIRAKYEASNEKLETINVPAKKSNITVNLVALVWAPHTRTANGALTPVW